MTNHLLDPAINNFREHDLSELLAKTERDSDLIRFDWEHLGSDNGIVAASNAIEETIARLAHNPPNDLPNEVYQATIKAGWEDQWLNWDDLGGDDPGWGDIGD